MMTTESKSTEARPRRPFTRRALDPRCCNIGHDANALNRNGTANDQLIDRFLALADAGDLNIVVGGGVPAEIQHLHTPRDVKTAVLPRIFNLRPGLNSVQKAERHRVHAILQGNAAPNQAASALGA
jgi:hypothetical protein